MKKQCFGTNWRGLDFLPAMLATLLLLLGGAATAAPIAPSPQPVSQWLYFATNFNAFIFGDLTTYGGDCEGLLTVGGNFTVTDGSSYSVGYPVVGEPLPTYTNGVKDALIVGGDFHDRNNFGVNGNIVYGGSYYSNCTRYPTAENNLVYHATNITFDAAGNVSRDGAGKTWDELHAIAVAASAQMASFEERGVEEKSFTRWSAWSGEARLTGSDPEFNVFHVSAEDWSMRSAARYIEAPAGATVLINIHGGDVGITYGNMSLTGVDNNHLILNYVDATNITTTSYAHCGAVLAPYASGTFSAGNINGYAVFGGDVAGSNGFEFHNFPFKGSFPRRGLARLYGYAFLDLDDSLTESRPDNLLNAINVRLYTNGVLVATTRTAANGFYEFNDLLSGNYEIRFFGNPGELVDRPAAGTPAASDPRRQRADDAGGYGVAYYTLYAGHGIGDDVGEPVNVGYKPPDNAATIGDFVWHDINRNGVQDDGEPGIKGVGMKLYAVAMRRSRSASATNLTLVASATTDDNGYYLFKTAPGVYRICIDPPGGCAFSPKHASCATCETDSDFEEACRHCDEIHAEPNAVILGIDAGIYYLPTLSVITSFSAYADDGNVFVEWETAAEYDTLGYWIERLDNGAWTRLNPDGPVYSELNEHPTVYTLADPGATPGGRQTWRVIEIENSGAENIYGPYTVTVDGAAADYDAWAGGIDWDGAASGRDDDPDGDGLANFEEFLAGTDPLEANSVLKILGIRPVANGIEIRWASVSGKVYAIEHCRTLDAPWLPVKTGFVADGPESRFVLPGADSGFFRVVLTAEP
ncbi:MAG: choice-of-anchor A family protein [Kiritimatiellia bacterium]|jgi:choice-of-anchor A domain-containing protein